MPEFDLTDRITEQLGPIIETLKGRMRTELSGRDKAAVAFAIDDAARMGARVAWASVLANAAEAGVELPPTLNLEGLQSPNLWPFED